MIQRPDREIYQALEAFPVPEPLTVETLFSAMQERYPRPLELWRGKPSPIPGLHANALWMTRPQHDSDVIWLDPALTGLAAVHSLAHELGHIQLDHKPLVLPATPVADEDTYEFLSPEFLGGCLLGRTRSQEGPADPHYQRIEDQAENFAFLLRRRAAAQAHNSRYQADPLLDRLHNSL
ncbi:hypothetical protein ACIP9H_33505 [Streptomyces sp. NPDC088732]|uniref:hypothetical protein n=1 Tax=Streptomyces sp. NPDC088732 TaxID=3365879 RepID=UPI00381C87B7